MVIRGPYSYIRDHTLQSISKEVNGAKAEYMNMGPFNYRSSVVPVSQQRQGRTLPNNIRKDIIEIWLNNKQPNETAAEFKLPP